MISAANSCSQPARWQFLNTGFRPGAFNMHMDESLARALSRGDGSPTLRVYGWAPHALSLGFHQQMSDIDERRCAEYGIDIVRRPTGGRAILHADELTYSAVMEGRGKNISTVYAEISEALVTGLRSLGADVDFARAQPDLGRLYQSPTSIPCFSSSSRFEIQSRGKKLVGSAQRRYASAAGNDVVLQHGSILLGPGHQLLSELVDAKDLEFRRSLRTMLETKTTDLTSVLGASVSFDEVAVAIRKGFEEAWNIEMTDIEYEAFEVAGEMELAHDNHSS